MPKRTFDVSFKKEVIEYIDHHGTTAYDACKFFSARDKFHYNEANFYSWYKNRDQLLATGNSKKRASGGGRKPVLGELEDVLADEIIEMRIQKMKVTRSFISDRATEIARENNIVLDGCQQWVTKFMRRYGFSLRRCTNLTTLTDEELVQRAVQYLTYLKLRLPNINIDKTLLMDETAIYFEDTRKQTVDIAGRHHVVIKSTGFSSMRITAAVSIWANGNRAAPLIIHKGREGPIQFVTNNGPLLFTHQSKAWVNAELLIKWIDCMFPIIDISPGKCIIWDSCRAHIATSVKEHCRKRSIEMIVIPGGMTPYLQAGDIGIYRELKDNLSDIINEWKNSDQVPIVPLFYFTKVFLIIYVR